MKHVLVAAALALALPMASAAQAPFNAQEAGLSQPVVVLTPTVAQNADALQLNDEQRAAVKAWMETGPVNRVAREQAAVALREQLRQQIIAGAPVEERQELARQIGDAEADLVMMRSACVDHWREVLTEEQFAEALRLAKLAE
ncbi:hypothetical protein [Paracoccus alkenifer]|uniref:LTXXQ motif family protein n=1 Tax=Paracoccus alkenifer TaxID=65735 RepID=A0A1H6L256_9RHOB|nr:hypothetical protein [Paracoccus alkenifer]SEH80335.1 hypothetical protein SAMN04488075_1156 [Paracoccus alkenifer]